jgi:NADH:ubiquinone oxidoreductase subunit F (NADH-binding)
METNMLNAIIKQILAGRGSWRLLNQVNGPIDLARGQGVCTLINMPVAPIMTGLSLFRSEFDAHIESACLICTATQDVVTGALPS